MNQIAANKIDFETKELQLATSKLQTAFCIDDVHKGVIGKIPSIQQIVEKSSPEQEITQMLRCNNISLLNELVNQSPSKINKSS
ncbi:unnamed protein product [Diamesa serratosioi]